MKRSFIVISLMALVAIGTAFSGSCFAQSGSPTSPPTQSAVSFDTVREYLLTSAATDFNEHQPPFPAKFRNVRIGHIGDTSKSGSYRMCGEFFPEGDEAEWIGFVTIKTSGYEQYIGSGTTYCSNPKIIWDTTGDLATTLKERLDAIKTKKQ